MMRGENAAKPAIPGGGNVPLLMRGCISPLTAHHDLGLVVQPRFPWAGIGPMLAEMGWLISPTPLKLPPLKRSERRVPLWVLSFMVLARFKALLDRLDRRFEGTTETRSARSEEHTSELPSL